MQIRFSISLFIYMLLLLTGCKNTPCYEEELQCLDEALTHNDEWSARKEHSIKQLHDKLCMAAAPEERYWINKDLYLEFLEYDADSAGYYVAQNLQLARQLGKPEEEQRWRIEQALVLIQTGQLNEAEQVLNRIRQEGVFESKKAYFYAQVMYLNIAYSFYMEKFGTADRSRYFMQALQYRDSVLAYSEPGQRVYLNVEAWKSYDAHDYSQIMPLLKERADQPLMNNMPENAISAYILSQMYREEGNLDAYIYYLTRSCLAYVKSGNRNYATESLQQLSSVLSGLGDLDRAYTYMNYCSANIYQFKNRAQIVRISELQENIRKQYLAREQQHNRIIRMSLGGIVILTIGLGWAIFFILRQVKLLRQHGKMLQTYNTRLQESIHEKEALHEEQRRMNLHLQEANREQRALNERLSQSNRLLKEANVIKETYIGYVFTLCSDYMGKLNEFRKTANRKLKAGQLQDLEHFLTSTTLMQNELKGLYSTFDEIFLLLYPNFVKDLNTLLQPDKQIELKGEKQLNTDLRILALMSLGVTDTNKIADFLHCSIQSIYNSRRLVYSRLQVPVKEFKEKICSLGR